ncbi:MAG TPA: hypothetical protein VFF14_10295 [Candidatus Deferrimicrobium sp.]|nr:hypothetical protein [Candidatus Deferrimicrobium sp.]
MQYYLLFGLQTVKWIFALAMLTLSLIAGVTKNIGALAVLILAMLLLGTGFNFLQMRRWVPGFGRGSWFSQSIVLSIYIFLGLVVLLIANPTHP